MKTIRLLVSNTAPQLIGKVVTAGSTMLITRLISSKSGLGKDGYNEFVIITAFAAYFYILTDFGLNAIAVKDITEDESKSSSYMANLLSLRLVMAIGLMILALVILVFLPYSTTIKAGCIVMLLTILTQGLLTNSNVIFQARLRYSQSMIATLAGSAVSLILVYLVSLGNGNLFGYLFSMLAGSVVMGGVAVILAGLQTPIRLAFDFKLWSRLLWLAFPLGITIIFNLAYFKSDAFILSIVQSDVSLQLSSNIQLYSNALYGLAYKIFEVALVIPIFVVNVLYPIMLKTAQRDIYDFRRLVVKASVGLLAISLVGSALIYILSPMMIHFISEGNNEFEPSIKILQLLGLTLPLFFLTNIMLWSVMTLGKQKILGFFYAISAVVNIGLNVWLIPHYGYMAAILTTAITEIVTGLLLGGLVWQMLHGNNLKEIAASQQSSETLAADASGAQTP